MGRSRAGNDTCSAAICGPAVEVSPGGVTLRVRRALIKARIVPKIEIQTTGARWSFTEAEFLSLLPAEPARNSWLAETSI